MTERPSFLSLVSPPPLKQRQRPSSLTITTNGALKSSLGSSSSWVSSSAEVSSPGSLAQPWCSANKTGFISTPLEELTLIKTPTRTLLTPGETMKRGMDGFSYLLKKNERSPRPKNLKLESDAFLYERDENGELWHRVEEVDLNDTTKNYEDLWMEDTNAMECDENDFNTFFTGSSSFNTTPGGRIIRRSCRTPSRTPISGFIPDLTSFLPVFPGSTRGQIFSDVEESWE